MASISTNVLQREELFSALPMPTWRWLGVNKAPLPAELSEKDVHLEEISVADGTTEYVSRYYKEQGIGDIDAVVGKGGTLRLEIVQLAPVDAARASSIRVRVEEDAKVQISIVELGAKESVSKLEVILEGDRAKADIASIYYVDGKRKLDLNYIVRHQGKETDASMYVDGALLEQADKIFRGTLDFVQGSTGSVGREKESVILLSSKARNRSVPLMLSGEGDVDGHHAVSIGKMDESKLFYLMSRGLDLAEARRLVIEASFLPVIDRLEDEELQKVVKAFLERSIEHAEG